MRYDTPIYFQLIRQGIYDPKTGDYADSDPAETKVYADVTDTSTDTKQILYGDIKRNSKVIRLQQHYTKTYTQSGSARSSISWILNENCVLNRSW